MYILRALKMIVAIHGFYTILTQMCMHIDNDTKNLIELLELRAEHSGLPTL